MLVLNAGAYNKADRSIIYVKELAGIFLEEVRKRLQADLQATEGEQESNLDIEDVYRMQQGANMRWRIAVLLPAVVLRQPAAASKTVALSCSKPCETFTEDEWEGFNYALVLVLPWEMRFDTWCHTAWI